MNETRPLIIYDITLMATIKSNYHHFNEILLGLIVLIIITRLFRIYLKYTNLDIFYLISLITCSNSEIYCV